MKQIAVNLFSVSHLRVIVFQYQVGHVSVSGFKTALHVVLRSEMHSNSKLSRFQLLFCGPSSTDLLKHNILAWHKLSEKGHRGKNQKHQRRHHRFGLQKKIEVCKTLSGYVIILHGKGLYLV